MELRKDSEILFRGNCGELTKGRVRQIYNSGAIRVWRTLDGHNVVIEEKDITHILNY